MTAMMATAVMLAAVVQTGSMRGASDAGRSATATIHSDCSHAVIRTVAQQHGMQAALASLLWICFQMFGSVQTVLLNEICF